MVIEQERPGTRTIWEDNFRGFNYRLFFEDTADENAPERVTLVKRTENIPTEEILWTFDFCSVDKMEAAFATLNNMLAALSEFVDTKCSIKTFAFVESYPDFTETPLKNGTLVATVTKNGSDVLTPIFEVVNGNVFSNSVALEWTKDFASFLMVNNGFQFIVCIGTEPKLEAVYDYTVALSYTSDNYIEDYITHNVFNELSVIKDLGLSPVPSSVNATISTDKHSITWDNFRLGELGGHLIFSSVGVTNVCGNFMELHLLGKVDNIYGITDLGSFTLGTVGTTKSAVPFFGSCILKVKKPNGEFTYEPAHVGCRGNSAGIEVPFGTNAARYDKAEFDLKLTCVVL